MNMHVNKYMMTFGTTKYDDLAYCFIYLFLLYLFFYFLLFASLSVCTTYSSGWGGWDTVVRMCM